MQTCPLEKKYIISQITLLQAINSKCKSHIPEYLQYRDRGYMYFPTELFLPFLRAVDTCVRKCTNPSLYGSQIVEVCRAPPQKHFLFLNTRGSWCSTSLSCVWLVGIMWSFTTYIYRWHIKNYRGMPSWNLCLQHIFLLNCLGFNLFPQLLLKLFTYINFNMTFCCTYLHFCMYDTNDTRILCALELTRKLCNTRNQEFLDSTKQMELARVHWKVKISGIIYFQNMLT